MSRIIGTETEFGIVTQGPRLMDAVSSSTLIVNSYPLLPSQSVLWDYENENPLMDARGFEVDGERERPASDYNRLLNKVLANGGRFYVDGAHPEYATPECSNVYDLIAYEKAGERILEQALSRARHSGSEERTLHIYKNNTDHKGNSYGYHENYLVSRGVPFQKIVDQMMPFLVTRQIFCGAGKVGHENRTEAVSYQISQRADFFEALVDLNTMVKRPIINTRDEPHADPKRYRRLHVIVGDSNMSEVTTFLKVGTTSLILAMLEPEGDVAHEASVAYDGIGFQLENPVWAIRAISRDLTLRKHVKLSGGKEWSAIEIQRAYLDQAERFFEASDNPTVHAILHKWRAVLDQLAIDPMKLSREIDWVIKKEMIDSYTARKGWELSDPRVTMLDLQYHDVVQEKGLYYALERGRHVDRITSSDAVAAAEQNPPTDTRAYFRGACLKKFPKEVYAISWSSILFNTAKGIKKVPLMDPLKGGKSSIGTLLERSNTVEELLSMIAA